MARNQKWKTLKVLVTVRVPEKPPIGVRAYTQKAFAAKVDEAIQRDIKAYGTFSYPSKVRVVQFVPRHHLEGTKPRDEE